MGQRKQYTASFKAKRLQESDHRKSPPENRRQSRRGRAPAGSQPEIFLGALQRTQGEIACRGNRVVSPTCRLASPGSQWFPRDADQQVRESPESRFFWMRIQKNLDSGVTQHASSIAPPSVRHSICWLRRKTICRLAQPVPYRSAFVGGKVRRPFLNRSPLNKGES